MPDVISNTSPLQYLYQLGLMNLLFRMYGKIIIPDAVVLEIDQGRLKGISLPDLFLMNQIEVRSVREKRLLPLVSSLGPGEREVIALGLESPDPLIILDDLPARRHADFLGLKMTGTLGIILKAKELGYIEKVVSFLDKLDELHFRLDRKTRLSALKLSGESVPNRKRIK